MKRNGTPVLSGQEESPIRKPKTNGHNTAVAEYDPAELVLILERMQAMRDGDFSVRLPGSWTGLSGKMADTFNEIAMANQRIAKELRRVGQVVGKKGRTRERARFDESRGAWGEIEDSVNTLVEDLLRPTAEVTRAIAAVADGNLTQTVRMDVDGRPLEGDFLRSAKIVNTMIQQLGVFTSEVTRVAREVGTDGKLGGQAQVPGVAGTWKDLTDSVNSMASNLTSQVRNIAEVATAVASGDLSRKITVDVRGEILQLKEAINTMVDQLRSFASEVTRVAREVGTDGKLGGQAVVLGVAGTWKDLTDSVNAMAGNLTAQVRNIAEVTTAVARGDLSRKITVDVKGEILELKNTINTMVDQLNAFAGEVTRVAREVGTEGKLGGQAAGSRSGRYLERPYRQRQLYGQQPDWPGTQYCRSCDRDCQRRSFPQDHGGRPRRDPAAQRNSQHHGGSTQPFRGRGHARGARSRIRRAAWWAGQCARRCRYLERPY